MDFPRSWADRLIFARETYCNRQNSPRAFTRYKLFQNRFSSCGERALWSWNFQIGVLANGGVRIWDLVDFGRGPTNTLSEISAHSACIAKSPPDSKTSTHKASGSTFLRNQFVRIWGVRPFYEPREIDGFRVISACFTVISPRKFNLFEKAQRIRKEHPKISLYTPRIIAGAPNPKRSTCKWTRVSLDLVPRGG